MSGFKLCLLLFWRTLIIAEGFMAVSLSKAVFSKIYEILKTFKVSAIELIKVLWVEEHHVIQQF